LRGLAGQSWAGATGRSLLSAVPAAKPRPPWRLRFGRPRLGCTEAAQSPMIQKRGLVPALLVHFSSPAERPSRVRWFETAAVELEHDQLKLRRRIA